MGIIKISIAVFYCGCCFYLKQLRSTIYKVFDVPNVEMTIALYSVNSEFLS